MKKSILLPLSLVLVSFGAIAQKKYLTKTGEISFHSKSTLESIEAKNKQVTVLLKAETGDLAFKVLVKSFEFEKALMQEHFNENYMESDKFPNASFEGVITNMAAIDLAKLDTKDVEVSGKLTIHGVTKEVKTKGKISKKGDKIVLSSKFGIVLQDYGIKNDKPQNISSNIDLTVNAELSELVK